MRILLLFLVLIGTLNIGIAQEAVYGYGKRSSKTCNIQQHFEGVEVAGPIEVRINQGENTMIKIEGDENILPYVITSVADGRIRIGLSKKQDFRDIGRIIVYLTMPTLTSVEANIAARVLTNSIFKGQNLDVEVSGASRAELDFEGSSLNAYVDDASALNLSGRVDNLVLDVSNASSTRAEEMIAEVAKVEARNASSVKLITTKEINAEARSVSSIRYGGNPERVFRHVSSASSISKNH